MTKILALALATVVMVGTFATAADAATHRRRARHHAMNRHHVTRSMPARTMSRDSGSASTDALNQQSLNAARGGAAQ